MQAITVGIQTDDANLRGSTGTLLSLALMLYTAVVSCLGRTAKAAQENFEPYYESSVGYLKDLMSVTDEEMLCLRCQATGCRRD